MDPKQQVLSYVSEAIDCALQAANAYKQRITELSELAENVAKLKVALKKDPSGLPVIPLTVVAKAGASAFTVAAQASSALALAPFL